MNKHKLITIGSSDGGTNHGDVFYINSAFFIISGLSKEYPNFGRWFSEKVISNLHSGQRKILIHLVEDRISGVAIVKSTVEEKKICTIRVHPLYRRQGIGNLLIRRSFELLETEKPIITVSSKRIPQFKKILNYYGFKLEEKYKNLYMPNVVEYAFNGYLYSSLQKNQLNLNNLTREKRSVIKKATDIISQFAPYL